MIECDWNVFLKKKKKTTDADATLTENTTFQHTTIQY